MSDEIVKIDISSEMDIVLAHRYVIEIGELAGFSIGDQTRLATAVSEVARNILEFAGEGKLTFSVKANKDKTGIEACLVDSGPGIPDHELESVLKGLPITKKFNRGMGLANTRKLVDSLIIESGPKGTTALLTHFLPLKSGKIEPTTLNDWKKFFKEKKPVSPYEEIKNRNEKLLELNDQLQKINDELRLAKDSIQKETESFQFIANNISQIILKADANHKVRFSNQYWSTYTGLPEYEALNDGWQQAIYSEDLGELLSVWENGRNDEKAFECEVRLKGCNDQYLWHLLHGEAIHNAKGKVVMWIVTGSNIDSKNRFSKELEDEIQVRTQELILANKELSRSNAELEEFAYVASHDLKEPMRMVSSFTTLLAQLYGNEMTEKGNEYIGFILEGAQRMQSLVSDLLKFSSIGKTPVAFRSIDCNNLIKTIRLDLQEKIEATGAIITLSPLPEVLGIESLVHSLFQNLIENALKFRTSRQPEIAIFAEDTGQMWKFCIKDNGIGISPEFFNKIFTIFQRLHDREEYPGTGIGLSICKKIVELHGGTIWLTSEENKGASFYFTLPKG